MAKKKTKKMTPEEQTRRQKKCKSVRHLAENIHTLRSKVSKDLRSDDEKTRLTALAVALMDKTASRVGNDESAKSGHFGVTGWRNKHVTVSGNTVTIKYVGKSGVDQEKTVTDAQIAKMLKKCKGDCKGDNPLLTTSDGLSIKSAQVNRYLKEFGITAKDIRGYAANTLLVKALKQGTKSPDEKERQKKFSEVIKEVAEKVGHGAATLKQHYMLPGIEEDYVKRSKVKEVKNASISFVLGARMGREIIANSVCRWAVDKSVEEVNKKISDVRSKIEKGFDDLFGRKHALPSTIKVVVSDTEVPDGKVASYEYKTNTMTISTKAFEKAGLLKYVVMHELAHAAIGKVDGGAHNAEFKKLADFLGIPERYQD